MYIDFFTGTVPIFPQSRLARWSPFGLAFRAEGISEHSGRSARSSISTGLCGQKEVSRRTQRSWCGKGEPPGKLAPSNAIRTDGRGAFRFSGGPALLGRPDL